VSDASTDDAIRTLQERAAKDPGNATVLAVLSSSYAMANQPQAALAAIEAALALEPANPAHLRSQATLATWLGNYDRARDSYRQLAKVQPLDIEVRLGYARVSAWAGDTDNAVREYRAYLAERPDAAAVWLELSRAESWRGNYAAAREVLTSYRERFGETRAYLAETASIMANSGHPSAAHEVLEPLLAEAPTDYGLNLTRTLAFARQQRSREAEDSLDTLRTLGGDEASLRSAERIVRTELASSAEPRVSVYSDSDQLQVQRFAPTGTLALASGTRIKGTYERILLDAEAGSGLEQVDGTATADVTQFVAGLSQKLGRVTFDAQIGQASVAGRGNVTYAAQVNVRPVDTLLISAERSEGLFIVSPRTVGLGMTQLAHRVRADWSLGMRYYVAFDGLHQELSDGNERTEITLSPRVAIVRQARFNLDMGVSAYRLETTRNLDNGYYDPRRYEHYGLTAFPYFKAHENVGVALTVAAGVQRETASSFHFGGSIGGEATFGIYEHWLFKVNSTATLNQRLESGAFRGFGAGVALVRRF
jgi:tetratricopeptide (TPR) repeat protein